MNPYLSTKELFHNIEKVSLKYKLLDNEIDYLKLASLCYNLGQFNLRNYQEKNYKKFIRNNICKTRAFLWKELDYSGTENKRDAREIASCLIGFYSLPIWLFNLDDPKKFLKKAIRNNLMIKHFKMKFLYAFIESIIYTFEEDKEIKEKLLKNLVQIQEIVKEINFKKQKNDNAWGEIVLMSGLPASGKTTFIKNNFPEMPVISLDDIREEFNISPKDNQKKVVQIAKDRAIELMEKHQPFIWDATTLIPELRKSQVDFFKEHGAKTKIIYLETNLKNALKRNKIRSRTVDEDVIDDMINRIIPPNALEADEVEWIIT